MQLIFIHGSGSCMESWKFQTEYFQGSEAINLPGHPDGDLCATIEEYVKWLHNYVHQKRYKDVVLIGHSLGGAIALQYALEHGSDLKGIILIGSGARLRVHPRTLKTLEKYVENPNEAINTFDQMYKLGDSELDIIIKRRAEENGLISFLNDLRACDRFDVMERLKEIQIPILAICGDLDVMTPPKYSNFLAETIPRTKAVVIPGGTHMVFAEKPKETNQAIDAFIEGL